MDVVAERELRKTWEVGSKLEVYSKSKARWFPAKIIEVYTDEEGEWLAVIVAETMIKEVQRFNKDVRPLAEEPPDSGSDDESSGSVADSLDSVSHDDLSADDSDDSSALSTSEDDSENDSSGAKRSSKKKKKKKKRRQLEKHAETIVIYVERSGNSECNGKYMYHTTADGFPVFKKVQEPMGEETEDDVKIWCEEDSEDDERFIWRFTANGSLHLYCCDDLKGIPPSSGWKPLKGEIPVPGVRLDSLKQEEKETYFVDDPFKFSPFDILNLEFKTDSEPGFSLKIKSLHSRFVVIADIEDGSQAEDLFLKPNDILVSVNDEDLSNIKSVDEVTLIIGQHMGILQAREDGSKLKMKFAREKSQFQVMIVARAGTREVDGKYTISGEYMDALRFVKNSDPSFVIHRMYVKEEEDESIWALKNKAESKDYYIMLAHAKDQLPPECGWQAVDPSGMWPAPGLTYYDVDIVPPPKPVLVSVEPNPGAVQIKWTCGEPRKPAVCPHMDVWYEIECRHLRKAKWHTIEGFGSRKGSHGRGHSKGASTSSRGGVGGGAIKWDPALTLELSEEDSKSESGTGAEDGGGSKSQTVKVIKCDSSPYVFNKLVNGEKYVFSVRTCNQVSSTTSLPSKEVIPLKLPPKPTIRNIKGYPGELMVIFTCPRGSDEDVQATFEVIVTPPIPSKGQFHEIVNGMVVIKDDSLPVRLRHLKNGLEYKVIVAATNAVGITYSEPEMAYPSKLPPQPKLIKVEANSRMLTVHFDCPGYDEPDVRAWFEVDIDPPAPSIMDAEARKALLGVGSGGDESPVEFTYTDDSETDGGSRHLRFSSATEGDDEKRDAFSGLRSASSGGKRRGKSQRSHSRYKSRSMLRRKRSLWGMGIDEDDDENYVPPYRAEKRYMQSPIKIYPLNNGQEYTVRVKACTLSGMKSTPFYEPSVMPKGPPPQPKIVKVMPNSASCQIFFECDDYATAEYKAKFEVDTRPPSLGGCDFEHSPITCRQLRDGATYTFRVRAYNCLGKSKWSDDSKQATPLMQPPAPSSLKCVPFGGEMTVFWVCEELNQLHYQGWFEVETLPKTYRMVGVSRQQARVRRLQNGVAYRFRVTACNEVGRRASLWSDACAPRDGVMRSEYQIEKKRIACVMKEQLLEDRKRRAKEQTGARVAEFDERRREMMHLEQEKARKSMQKKLSRRKKKENERKRREAKKSAEKDLRKKKMEERRAHVLAQKRRISMVQRERIDVLQKQWTAKATPTASAIISRSKRKAARSRGVFATATAPRAHHGAARKRGIGQVAAAKSGKAHITMEVTAEVSSSRSRSPPKAASAAVAKKSSASAGVRKTTGGKKRVSSTDMIKGSGGKRKIAKLTKTKSTSDTLVASKSSPTKLKTRTKKSSGALRKTPSSRKLKVAAAASSSSSGSDSSARTRIRKSRTPSPGRSRRKLKRRAETGGHKKTSSGRTPAAASDSLPVSDLSSDDFPARGRRKRPKADSVESKID